MKAEVEARPHRCVPERRVIPDRRSRERRRVVAGGIALEHRSRRDRRTWLERRETAPGHIGNTLQILDNLLNLEPLSPDAEAGVAAAVERLYCALGEVHRLDAHRRYLMERLSGRVRPASGDGPKPA